MLRDLSLVLCTQDQGLSSPPQAGYQSSLVPTQGQGHKRERVWLWLAGRTGAQGSGSTSAWDQFEVQLRAAWRPTSGGVHPPGSGVDVACTHSSCFTSDWAGWAGGAGFPQDSQFPSEKSPSLPCLALGSALPNMLESRFDVWGQTLGQEGCENSSPLCSSQDPSPGSASPTPQPPPWLPKAPARSLSCGQR
jgi:hypothetical protein